MIFELIQRWVLRIGGVALAFNFGVWVWATGLSNSILIASGLVIAVAVVAAHLFWPAVLLSLDRYRKK